MNAFRYQAIEATGAPVEGVIEAEDRKSALQLLGRRGLFPSALERCAANGEIPDPASTAKAGRIAGLRFGKRISRKAELQRGGRRPVFRYRYSSLID